MKDFDAVVFDMDGVIFDSERATMNCWIELAEKYDIKNIEKPYLACTGTTDKISRSREQDQMTASKEKVTANDLRPTASEAWERMLPPSLQLEVQPASSWKSSQ